MDQQLTIPRYAPIINMILKFNVKVEIIEGTPITEEIVGNYVEIPNAEDINFDVDQDFSIGVWIRINAEQVDTRNIDNDIVEKWQGGGSPYPFVIRYLPGAHGGKGAIMGARFDGEANGRHHPMIMSADTNINDGKFHYVVFEKSGINLYLYIDGQLDPAWQATDPKQDTTVGSTQNSSPLYLAKRGNENRPNYFSGQIGQLRIWSISLTSEQIWSYYNQGPFIGHQDSLIAKPGLVGDWRCNEGYGNIAFDYARGNNGVLGGTTGESAKPEWVVSTIGLLPLFIDKAPSSFISMNSLLAQSKKQNIVNEKT